MPKAFRPTVARIDLGAIVSNFAILAELVGGRDRLFAVVKADAYGHGAVAVASALEKAGCTRFAVACLEEGTELREAGVKGEILTLFGSDPANADLLVSSGIITMVNSTAALKALARAGSKTGLALPVHLNFDTGMGRMGLMPHETGEALAILKESHSLALKGVSTHFSSAGQPGETTRLQMERFDDILASFKAAGVPTGFVHAANSAACLSEPLARYGGARTGIALYGVLPEPDLPSGDLLRPALEWTTSIMLLRDVPAGTPLSYSGSYVTRRPSRIATLPVGYADGFARRLSNEVGSVLVRGARAPVVGRICMDVTLVDVTDVPDVCEGDEAVLIGRRGDAAITADGMAETLGTISYEVLCSIGKRVPRIYYYGGSREV